LSTQISLKEKLVWPNSQPIIDAGRRRDRLAKPLVWRLKDREMKKKKIGENRDERWLTSTTTSTISLTIALLSMATKYTNFKEFHQMGIIHGNVS